jgi:hypothetical protein
MVLQRMESYGVMGNVQLFNSFMDLVAKSALYGCAEPLDGYAVLRRMRENKISPSVVTFNSLLEVTSTPPRFTFCEMPYFNSPPSVPD